MTHSVVTRSVRALAAPAVLAFAALQVHAAPVSVPLATFAFQPGSGYGVDASEQTGTLLDVLFTGTWAPQTVVLGTGVPVTVDLGTIRLREPNANGGIRDGERDGLGLGALFTFGDGFASAAAIPATVQAFSGSVSDAGADLVIDWNPVQVAFGSGGLLEIALADLSFSREQTLTQTATITLLSAPTVADERQEVPEPASLALFAAGLAALGATRRRRNG